MKLHPDPNTMSGYRWRQTEDDYITKFYGKVSLEEMAKILGRSKRSVRQRLGKLGIIKPTGVKRKRYAPKVRQRRELPDHLRDSFKHFICDVVEDNPEVQAAMRERLNGRMI